MEVQNTTTVFSREKTHRACRNMRLCAVFMTMGNHSSAKHRAVRNSTDSASRRCSPALPWPCSKLPLCGDVADKYRLSLGGVSSSGKEPLALQEFLRQHPEITTIELRLDNDAKGRMASVGIRKIYADRYTVHDLPPDIENGDYADMAKNNLMARTAAHRAVCR